MQFIIKAYGGQNMLEKQMKVRPQHLEEMAKHRLRRWFDRRTGQAKGLWSHCRFQ